MLWKFADKVMALLPFSVMYKSKYKVGEMVVHDEISYPLVVKQVVRSLRTSDPLMYCQWFDKSAQETRVTLVHESKLKPFDWQHAAKKA